MTNNRFNIKPYHWIIVISIAVIFHAGLLINYEREELSIITHNDISTDEIVISLKNFKTPNKVDTPTVIEPVQLIPKIEKPVPPVKPVPKKTKLIKPKNSVIDTNPVIKPKVVEPKIETFTKNNRPTVTNKKPISRKFDTSANSVNKISESTRRDQASYLAELSQWLERHKKYPSIARRRGQQGQAVVKFTINKNGELVSHQLIKSSEHKSLNTAAIKMLERASPMPKPPVSLIGDKNELTYSIPVNFSLVQ